MTRLLPIILSAAVLLVSCDGDSKFNGYGYLTVEPKPSEAVATYRLNSSSAVYPVLMEMGYTSIDSAIRIESDHTFTGTGVPECCLTGDDVRVNRLPLAGGIYDIRGTWQVVKTNQVYQLEFRLSEITRIAEGKGSDSILPEKLEVPMIIGTPFTIGFDVYNGDFWPIAYDRIPSER